MAILVEVIRASGLPGELANDVRVEYEYFVDEKPHQVGPVPGPNCNPEFNYKQTFVQDPVTSRFLEYLQTKLVFRVYGRDAAAAQMAIKLSEPTELTEHMAKLETSEEKPPS